MTNSSNSVKKNLQRKPTDGIIAVDFDGRIPPQAREMEEVVLGALMIEADAAPRVQMFLMPEMFYVNSHKLICQAIIKLIQKREPVDLLTVREQLAKSGELEAAGGAYYLAQLTNKVGTAANIEFHARVVFEKYINRVLISQSNEIAMAAYEDTTDCVELFDRAERYFRDTSNLFRTGSMPSTKAVLEKADEQVSSGFVRTKHDSLNRAMGGGWQMGTLTIIAGRPGMGKTALLNSEIINCVDSGVETAVFNLEMMERQTVMRLICGLTGIPNTRYKKKELWHYGDEEKVMNARKWIVDHDSNFTMDFTAAISVYELIGKMRKIKRDKGLKIVFIDYLQLMTLPPDEMKGKNKDQQIGVITQALKSFAKQENIAIILCSQLSRAVEESKDKKPNLTHLRESGNIEQDADVVLFLLRPEYYFEREADGRIIYANPEQERYKNVCCFINAKNRDDMIFESKEYCNMATSIFSNWEGDDNPF